MILNASGVIRCFQRALKGPRANRCTIAAQLRNIELYKYKGNSLFALFTQTMRTFACPTQALLYF
jgi:hypothetical protein